MWLPRAGWGSRTVALLLNVDLRVAGVRGVVELGLEERRLVSTSASTAVAGSVTETMSRWRLSDVAIGASTDADMMNSMACSIASGRANFAILEVRDFACFCGSKYAPSM